MLYSKDNANYPRLKTDVHFINYGNDYKYHGFMDNTMKYIEDFQLLNTTLWERFVHQFRTNADSHDAGWRGEYWGKMMRGASFVYAYTKNPALYEILCKTVNDMIESADEYGRISTYTTDAEFDGWDIWSRKYVLLGMQYFMEVCEDEELCKKMVSSMCKQVDYIMSKIGREEDGKKPITSATRHWRGLNSSSILEPVVRLYTITGNKSYLDFAEYIVGCGGMDIENVFELAYKNELYPYQFPITKAYEMISCFEGLLEYYRITGEEKHKTAIVQFADKLLETDFTVIGCCGCTHELFDHSTARQANGTNGKTMQETCVTVTLMKFFAQLSFLTGDNKYVDAFEISLYNAYLGAVNTEKVVEKKFLEEFPECNQEPLPFDSYSPLTAGTRGNGIGGFRIMEGNYYYGCCACIGAAGIGLVPKMQMMTKKNGLALNLYIDGSVKTKTPGGNDIEFLISTEYPRKGNIKVTLNMSADEEFELALRNPAWSKETTLTVNGEEVAVNEGYILLNRVWKNGDKIELCLDMRTVVLYPVPYGEEILVNQVLWGENNMKKNLDKEDPLAHLRRAYRRGPVMLAQEQRLGYDVDAPVNVKSENDYVDAKLTNGENVPYPHIVSVEVPLENGSTMLLTDYASAGKLWNEETKMAVWMLREE